MDVKEIATDKVIPYARNPRRNDAAVAAVAASIREFGFRQPIVVDEEMNVLVGHTRLKAAQSLGLTKVPVHIAKGLTESQRKAYRIADNKLNDLAVWDDEMLALELVDLQNASYDLTLTGFDEEEIKKLEAMANATTEGLTDPDDVPDVDTTETRTKLHDIWLLGKHRVMCGDSTVANDVARLMDGAKADLCFTSPPYASQRKYDESSGFKPIPPDRYCDWWAMVQKQVFNALSDEGSFIVNIKEHAEGGERHAYVKRMTLRMIDEWGWKWIDEYAWIRKGIPGSAEMMGRFRNAWESVFWFAVGSPIFNPRSVMHESDNAFKYSDQVAAGKTIGAKNQGTGNASNSSVGHGRGMAYPSNVLDIQHNAETLGHSAAFPVQLPSFFIKANANEGGMVYEPFLGSGTTLIAAEGLGRICYGMEISPQYVDVTVKRWEMFTGKTAYKLEAHT